MVPPTETGSQRARSRKKKGAKRTKTDSLRGIVAVKLKDGSVRYRASIPGGRRGAKTWTPLLNSAEQAAELRQRVIEKRGKLPTLTMTFEQAIEATRDDFERRCRPATVRWFNDQVPALRAFFGRMLVSSITPQDVERFAAQQMSTKLSHSSVLHRRRGLRAILSHTAEQLVNGDPMKGVRRGTWPQLRKGKVTAPEPSEIRAFLQKVLDSGSARAEEDHDIAAALFLSGLRRAEFARLRVEDLRANEGRIFVQGKNRDEWLPVNFECMTVLQRMALRVGEGVLVPGGIWEIAGVMRRRSQQTGIHLSPHALRRAFVTALIRAGHDVATVARYSRHSTDEIERYMAANEDDRRVLAGVSIERPKKRRARLRKVE